jgi:hypothetical protein
MDADEFERLGPADRLYPPDMPGLRERLETKLLALDHPEDLSPRDLARLYTEQVLDDRITQEEREDGHTTRWGIGRENVVFLDEHGDVFAIKSLDEVTYAAFPHAYPDGPPKPVDSTGIVPFDSLDSTVRDYIESRFNTVTGERVTTPEDARNCIEDLFDVLVGDGTQKDGLSYERGPNGQIIVTKDGEMVRVVTVDGVARRMFPRAYGEDYNVTPDEAERWEELLAQIRPGALPEGDWSQIADCETAMTLMEGIVDDLVQYGPKPIVGEEDRFDPDIRMERASRGRVISRDSKTGEIVHESTIEALARKQFPKAFEVHPYGRWEDAMIEQARLYEFSQSDLGHRYLDEFEHGMNLGHVPGARLPEGFLQKLQAHMLNAAEPVWIAPEVIDMIHHARDHESFRPEAVLGSDAFVPTGFCLLSRPLRMHDEPDSEQLFRAVGWYSVMGDDDHIGCFWISLYAHVDDGMNAHGIQVETPEWRRANCPLMLSHYFQWTWGAKPWEEGVSVLPAPGEADDTESRRRAAEQSATMQVLWRLSQQFVPVAHRAPRGLRRDTKRRLKRDLQTVNVIKLRRERSVGEHEETDRHYHVSFLVQGYWAPRWMKQDPKQPPGGPMIRRIVWVRAHTKGQGPFKRTKRAWEFVR